MSTQTDWITPPGEPRPARVVRDTSESVADQKGRLSLKLHRLCCYCPTAIRGADVFKTREWVARQGRAKKVAANARSSVTDPTVAITSLEGYLTAPEIERLCG